MVRYMDIQTTFCNRILNMQRPRLATYSAGLVDRSSVSQVLLSSGERLTQTNREEYKLRKSLQTKTFRTQFKKSVWQVLESKIPKPAHRNDISLAAGQVCLRARNAARHTDGTLHLAVKPLISPDFNFVSRWS